MKIEASKKGDIWIISVEGRVDSKSVPDFEKGILEIADRGGHKLIINCRGLTYISSLGLRVFLLAQKKILSQKGVLYLCELTRPVLETVSISGFTTIFKIFETEEEAIGA